MSRSPDAYADELRARIAGAERLAKYHEAHGNYRTYWHTELERLRGALALHEAAEQVATPQDEDNDEEE